VKASDGTGYDDSINKEYKVWVSTTPLFEESNSKTDNFRVNGPTTGPEGATLNVIKFYDANANGEKDPGEVNINGWQIIIEYNNIHDTFLTPVNLVDLPSGTYLVTESTPTGSIWQHTTATSVEVTLAPGDDKTVSFGNLCLGGGGGLTLGFWSNKNGQALFTAADFATLGALNLRNAIGANVDPLTYAVFRSWILSATAMNMAYMLSAQLAAMKLNVIHQFVTATSLVYAPGTTSANLLGYATIANLMEEANTELGLHGLTLSGSADRSHQEALKNALDKANNNLNFVQSAPCTFTFPETP
jgi:hypothetical protein